MFSVAGTTFEFEVRKLSLAEATHGFGNRFLASHPSGKTEASQI
jgi:hypothetical protein